MSSYVFVHILLLICTLELVLCAYSSGYVSSYKGVQPSGILYQKVPVPVYQPVPVYKSVPVPVSLTKGIGGYGSGGFPGLFGGYGGGETIFSIIFLVIIVSVLRGLF